MAGAIALVGRRPGFRSLWPGNLVSQLLTVGTAIAAAMAALVALQGLLMVRSTAGSPALGPDRLMARLGALDHIGMTLGVLMLALVW